MTAAALYLAQRALAAGRVRTTVEAYAAGIAARMMVSPPAQAGPPLLMPRKQAIAGSLADVIVE